MRPRPQAGRHGRDRWADVERRERGDLDAIICADLAKQTRMVSAAKGRDPMDRFLGSQIMAVVLDPQIGFRPSDVEGRTELRQFAVCEAVGYRSGVPTVPVGG